MSKPIIEISGLGKKYRIGAHKEFYLSLRDSIACKARGFAQRISLLTTYKSQLTAHHSQEDFWALKDVSFSVQQGEAVGIIGRNGAGKSTLLKILSQITPPTEGEITCRGRIASLLEVGTGFHPELTGRENIFLNGAILGMRRHEIESKFDEIVAFADLEKFLETPVKRYSSGMYMRLAFAVAAHLDPEILVVDEVLAVGDAEFQAKCLGKMGDVTRGGRTVLFVSHNMIAVEALCSRAVWLNQGRIQHVGDTKVVIQRYLEAIKGLAATSVAERVDREGDGSIRLTALDVCGCRDERQDIIATGDSVVFRLHYAVRRAVSRSTFGVGIFNTLGAQLIYVNTRMTGHSVNLAKDKGSLELRMARLPLPPGHYRVNVAVTGDQGVADRVEAAAVFEVKEGRFYGSGDLTWYKDGWKGLLVDHSWGPCAIPSEQNVSSIRAGSMR